MTNKQALKALIDAVDASFDHPTNWRDFHALSDDGLENPNPVLAHRAYHGSLDAAKANALICVHKDTSRHIPNPPMRIELLRGWRYARIQLLTLVICTGPAPLGLPLRWPIA